MRGPLRAHLLLMLAGTPLLSLLAGTPPPLALARRRLAALPSGASLGPQALMSCPSCPLCSLYPVCS